MNRKVAALIGLMSAALIGGSHAQDCSAIYNQLAAQAQMCGFSCDVAGLQRLESLYRQCLQGRQPYVPPQPAPRVDMPRFDPNQQLEQQRQNRIVAALNWVSGIAQKGRRGLYGSEPLSETLSKPQSQNPLSGFKPPPGFFDPFPDQSTKPIKLAPGTNPFTLQFDPALVRTMEAPSSGTTTPARLPPPGQLGRHGNCTFDSPSCR